MNHTSGRRARFLATGTQQRGHTHGATPVANTRNVNTQVPLFGPPVAQPAPPSAEQIALKRQRLTTTYEPLSPPEDDAMTADSVRMGVVTDQDGRHWRQQTMRLGRWVTHWKDTYPFAAEPVDVEDLTKAEKYWLDIKFRRRIPQRKMPIKKAPGHGCTGRYMALRRGNRGVLSGRVGKTSGNPPSGNVAGRDNDLSNPDGPDDGQGEPAASKDTKPPPRSEEDRQQATTLVSRQARGRLVKDVMADAGIKRLQDLVAGFWKDRDLRGLQDAGQGFSAEIRAQMAASASTTAAAVAAAGGGGGGAGDDAGPGFGPGTNFGNRPGTGQQHRRAPPGFSDWDPVVFVSAAEAAADQNRYWTESKSGTLIPRPINDPGHRRCSEDQLRRILVRDGDDLSLERVWVEMRQVHDNALVYVRDDRREWYMPLDRGLTDTPRVCHLRSSTGTDLTVDESQVGTVRAHRGAIILSCDPIINDSEWPSKRLVRVQLEGILQNVPDNKLGAYIGGMVNPPDESEKDAGLTVSQPRPVDPSRFVRFKETSRTTNSVLVSEVSNWGHQGRVIVDTQPGYDSLETPSSRLVHISTRPDMVDMSVPDNQLGRYPGAVLRAPPSSDSETKRSNEPEQVPINQGRLVVLRLRSGGPEVRIPVASASSARYMGAKIVCTIPGEDRKEPPSKTTVHVSDNGAHFDVPDNGLDCYRGWVISSPPNLTGKTPEKRQTGVQKRDSTLDREGRPNDTAQKPLSTASALLQGQGSSQSQGTLQSETSSKSSAPMEGQAPKGGKIDTPDKGSTQGNAPAVDKTTTQSTSPAQRKATTQTTPQTQSKATTLPTPPDTQANPAAAVSNIWETNVCYANSVDAPEFIAPTKKDFPHGRPDINGNLPEPRPPRAESKDVQRLRRNYERLVSKEAVRDHLATGPRSDTGPDTGPDTGAGGSKFANFISSLVGAVTVRAGRTAASTVGPPRAMIQGTSRADVRAGTGTGTGPAPPATTPTAEGQPKPTTTDETAAAKSSRVEKKKTGKGTRKGRNVRFVPLPTEADSGRERRSGLRTRSGALYGKQKRSNKGVRK